MAKRIIGIDLTSLNDNFSGLEREAFEFSKRIVKHNEIDFILFFKNDIYPYFKVNQSPNVTNIVVTGSKLKVLLFNLPKAIKKANPDVIFFPAFPPSPLFHKPRNMKCVCEIADMVCFDCPKTMKYKSMLYFKFGSKKAAAISDRILTISDFSKSRIVYNLHYPDNRIVIASPSTDLSSCFENHSINPSLYGLPSKYILCLSTIEPRKNLATAISWMVKAWQTKTDLPDLVLVGRKGWKSDDLLETVPSDLKQRIHFTGFVKDEDLPSIYKNASLFLFPSLYEGFGIPVLEALSMDTLVLCSDIPTSKEILPNYPFFFSLNSYDDFYKQLCTILSTLDKDIILSRAKSELQKYDWYKSSEQIITTLINC